MWGCVQGLDNETDCLGHITYTHWSYGEAHPKAFTPDDINADACAPPSPLPCLAPCTHLIPCTALAQRDNLLCHQLSVPGFFPRKLPDSPSHF